MNLKTCASSIVLLASIFLVAGCDSLGLPNLMNADEVPAEVKAAPLLVATPQPLAEERDWPRLADVPFKPKDYTPKPVYNHYIDELEYQRAEAIAAKQKAQAEDPVPVTAAPVNAAPQNNLLVPPQLPTTLKE